VVQSASDGTFAIRVPPANYEVRVERSGFQVFRQRVVVEPGRDSELRVALAVDPVTQTVTVRAGDVTVPTHSASATKTDTPLLETPQSVAVVTADQIREQASFSLQETLRYTAGVRNELYGVGNRGDWISLRGSDESTMLVDGMRLPLTGWYGVVRTEPYAYERIDVLRGPSSIIAGQNDPGGVVNLVSKRPRAETAREFGVRFGNYNRREVFGDLTGPLSRSWLYRLVGLGRDTDTQINHADEQRALVAPALTWRPNSRHSVALFGEYQYDRSKNTNAFLGLAGTLHPAPNGPIPTDLFIGEPDWDSYGGTRRRYGYATTSFLGESWQLRHNLRHDRVHGIMKSMYAAWWGGFVDENGDSDANGRYMGRQWYIYDDRSRVTTGDVLLQGNGQTGAVKHTVLFGVDGMVHDAGQRYAGGPGTRLNVYSPVYGRFPEPPLGDARLTENAIRRLGVLVQDQMKFFNRLSLRAGLRRDIVRNAVVGGEVQKDWATTGNVGLLYQLLPGLAPYASYSQSFNPIAGTDAAGRAFKPKRGEQVEVGLKWQAQSLPLQATMALYSLKEKNRLATDPVNFGYSVQIGDARTQGVELEAKGQLKSWTGLANYTYTRARASASGWGGDLDPKQQIEGIPEHATSVWAIHDFGHLRLPGFRLGGGVRHVGRIGDGTGKIFVPAVMLFDAMASFERGRLRYSININNLTDKAYIATCLARGDCWFGLRRTISLTVGFRY
jgi:iron complex outermembrane receptor protein